VNNYLLALVRFVTLTSPARVYWSTYSIHPFYRTIEKNFVNFNMDNKRKLSSIKETDSGILMKKTCINSLRIEEAFLQAIENRDFEKITACLCLGINVNVTLNENGFPVIFKACENTSILNIFLARGKDVDVNCKNPNTGETPLMWCSLFGLVDSAQRLCDMTNIDVNSQNKKGQTALMIALKCGHVDIVKLLLSCSNLNPNARDSDQKSIANYAVESDCPDAVKCLDLLCNYSGLDLNNKPVNGYSPIIFSWKNKKHEMFQRLLTVPNIELDGLQNNIIDSFFTDCLKKVPDMSRKVRTPSCPVCYDRFPKNGRIFQCLSGHFICENCRPGVTNCPTCRAAMLGRCIDFEQFLLTL